MAKKPRRLGRAHLGPHFNEGARQMWAVLARKGWTQAEVEAALVCPGGMINRILYGDARPGMKWLWPICRYFHLKPEDFSREPAETFAPPGATRAA